MSSTQLLAESQQLVIKSINVPAKVKIGEVDHVILDCDYELENTSEDGLVVKWFFGNDIMVYQWIHKRMPLATELVKRYVDLTYRASNNSCTEYRAMKLNNPGIELSGDYKCVISTFDDEKTANASMVIYSESNKFSILNFPPLFVSSYNYDCLLCHSIVIPSKMIFTSLNGLTHYTRTILVWQQREKCSTLSTRGRL